MRVNGRDTLDALIIGAGMVGGAAALALARAGLKVALVEQHPVSAPTTADPVDARVVAIAPHSQRLLQSLGVWESIAEVRASAYTHMQVQDALGANTLDFDAADYGWPCLGHIVENRLIAGKLWRALEAEPGIRLLLGDTLDSFGADATGVRARLSSGGELRARLLIGADGVNSRVRNELLIEIDGAPYGQSGVVAQLQAEAPTPRLAWQRFLPTGPLALLPLSDASFSMVWTLPTARAQELAEVSVEQLEVQLLRASDGRFGCLRVLSDRLAFPLRLQIARRFVAERAILIGDAAHVVHPLAGQGVNLGFDDVSALLEIVEQAKARGRAPLGDTDLARWGRQRRSEATLAARAFDGLNRLYGISEGPMVTVRALGLRLVDSMTPIKRKLAERAAGIRVGLG